MLPMSVPARIVRTSLHVPVYGLRLIRENLFNPATNPAAEPSAGIEPEFHPEEDNADGIVYTVVHFGLESIQSILSYLWHLPVVESVQTQVCHYLNSYETLNMPISLNISEYLCQ